VDKESVETLRRLKERLLRLRQEKSRLLETLDDLEADGESEADTLEKEIVALQSLLDEKRNPSKRETVFRF
jgi:hypothetical protein